MVRIPRIQDVNEYLQGDALDLYRTLSGDIGRHYYDLPLQYWYKLCHYVAYDMELHRKLMECYNGMTDDSADVECGSRHIMVYRQKDPDGYMKLVKHVRQYEDNMFYIREKPFWMVIKLVRPVKKDWLLHVTPRRKVELIMDEGFEVGVTDMTNLAYTKEAPEEFVGKGYNYAYGVDQALTEDTVFTSDLTTDSSYGAVLFRAPSVLVWHQGDAENQSIFWSDDATDIVGIVRNTDRKTERWDVLMDDRRVTMSGTWCKAVAWARDNYWQYRRFYTNRARRR